MTVTSLLSMAGAIFGLLGLVGGSVAYLAAMRQRTTIDVLETDNEALRNRVGTIEGLERDCQVRLAKAETTVHVLTETVTNAKAVADLLSKVDGQRTILAELNDKVDRNFGEMLRRLPRAAK